MEKDFLKEAYGWFGFVAGNPAQFASSYRAVILRFKALLSFLKQRPAYITPDIHHALQTAGYKNVLRNVVMVMNEQGEMMPRLIASDSKRPVPLGRLESDMLEFQNILSDKLLMIIQSITPADIAKANLGIKSKAARDLYSVVHLSRLQNKPMNPTLIGINISTSSVGEKLKGRYRYNIRNREA